MVLGDLDLVPLWWHGDDPGGVTTICGFDRVGRATSSLDTICERRGSIIEQNRIPHTDPFCFSMKLFDEFKTFALKGNVLDLAVGVIIGGAFGKIVSSLVNDIVMPPFGFVLQGIDFKNLRWVLQRGADGSVVASVNYGNFLQNLVEFLIVGFSIFFMVKALSTLKKRFEKQKAEEVASASVSSEEVQLLREIRDLLRK